MHLSVNSDHLNLLLSASNISNVLHYMDISALSEVRPYPTRQWIRKFAESLTKLFDSVFSREITLTQTESNLSRL